ncbi:hypothetical protein ASC84_07955 [Acinetobacter sp. Root1280]|nr:hypothetical protein ASC84_07955 [Acinetobacter sp. Root1280]
MLIYKKNDKKFFTFNYIISNLEIDMNLFNPPKYIRHFKPRIGEPRFVILCSFVCSARRQKFSKDDVSKIIEKSKKLNYENFIILINSHTK